MKIELNTPDCPQEINVLNAEYDKLYKLISVDSDVAGIVIRVIPSNNCSDNKIIYLVELDGVPPALYRVGVSESGKPIDLNDNSRIFEYTLDELPKGSELKLTQT